MQQARMQSVWKNHYDAHIRTLKQVLSHGLMLKKCIKWLNLIKRHGLNHFILIWILN